MEGTNCCHQGKLRGYIQATDSGGSRLTPFSGANAKQQAEHTEKEYGLIVSALDWDLADGVNSPSSCS